MNTLLNNKILNYKDRFLKLKNIYDFQILENTNFIKQNADITMFVDELEKLKSNLIRLNYKTNDINKYLYDKILSLIEFELSKLKNTDICKFLIKKIYFSLLRIYCINNEKEVYLNLKIILEHLKFIEKKYNKIDKISIIFLNKIEKFISHYSNKLKKEIIYTIDKIMDKKICEKEHHISQYSKYNNFELQKYKDIFISKLKKFISEWNTNIFEKISTKNFSIEYINTRVCEFSKLLNEKIEIKIVPDEFSILIQDFAYFSKNYLKIDRNILFINKEFIKNFNISHEQIDLVLTHEIYPGHAYHILNGEKSKYSDFQDLEISFLTLEGWAIYCEYKVSMKCKSSYQVFLLQIIRRYINSIYTINKLLNFSSEENIKSINLILNKYKIEDKYIQFWKKSYKFSNNILNYTIGFEKILKILKNNKINDTKLLEYGAIDINIIDKLLKYENI